MGNDILIKVCGVTRPEDAEAAASLGANICGFIFHKKSPRYITPQAVAAIPDCGIKRTGVFVGGDAAEICEIMQFCRLDFAQLHGDQSVECAKNIGPERVIRVLWPQRYASINELRIEAKRFADSCALYLLDAGKTGGGSGVTLDFTELANLNLSHPWLLAGGLGADNIEIAFQQCQPYGFDLNSGVEQKPGIKDKAKMAAVMEIIRSLNK